MTSKFYNSRAWLDRFIFKSPRGRTDVERVAAIGALIPADASTVLDIGFGGGYVYKGLKARRDIRCFGIDISLALARDISDDHVCVADMRHIPFRDEEFDLVLSADVLEHIEEDSFKESIDELIRVSNRYILINSPYKDEHTWPVCLCDRCKKEFNVYGHIRSIDKRLLNRLFPADRFRMLKTSVIADKRNSRPRPLVYLARRFGKVYSGDAAMCPHCLKEGIVPPSRNLFERSVGKIVCGIFALMDTLTPPMFKSGSEICVLLEKRKS